MGRVYQKLKNHLVESTAISTVCCPLYAVIETQIAGMSPEVSVNSRYVGTAINFLGVGKLYRAGRDVSKKFFGVTQETSERWKTAHDTLYTVGFNFAISPVFYYAAGSRDVKEIAAGAAAACAIGLVSGIPIGYAIDSYQDFAGIQKSERLPAWISKQSAYAKKAIATLTTAASIGATALYYYVI